MAKIKVTCDSTCDMTAEQYAKYGIEILPLGIELGGELRQDGVNVNARQVFEFVAKTGTLPHTSAVSPGEYLDVFRRYTDEGYAVIHINISHHLSTCYANACIAASELENVYPIDSMNLSTGSGHLAIAASEMAAAGMEAKDIVAKLEEMKTKLDVSFVLQTLEYLHKGGRCSGVAALGANVLKLRPQIKVADGQMTVGKKFRGSLEKTVKDYVADRLKDRTDIDTKRIFITHSGLTDEFMEELKVLVRSYQPFEEVLTSAAGCTISSHCGPKCMGVLFFTK